MYRYDYSTAIGPWEAVLGRRGTYTRLIRDPCFPWRDGVAEGTEQYQMTTRHAALLVVLAATPLANAAVNAVAADGGETVAVAATRVAGDRVQGPKLMSKPPLV